MPTVHFAEGHDPELKRDDVYGAFYNADDDMLVYVHKDHKEDEDLPILDELPPQEEFTELVKTRSFFVAKPLADTFRKMFQDLKDGRKQHDEVDPAD